MYLGGGELPESVAVGNSTGAAAGAAWVAAGVVAWLSGASTTTLGAMDEIRWSLGPKSAKAENGQQRDLRRLTSRSASR